MKQRGLINAIILIVVALIILGYFNIDIKSVVSTPAVQSNLSFAWQEAVWLWNHVSHYIIQPLGNFISQLQNHTSS